MDSFRAAYSAFSAGDEVTTREMLRLVSGLIAAGTREQDLLGILASDPVKSNSLRPLIVALHTRLDDPVRAPREIEEVATDIGRRFDEAADRMGR